MSCFETNVVGGESVVTADMSGHAVLLVELIVEVLVVIHVSSVLMCVLIMR